MYAVKLSICYMHFQGFFMSKNVFASEAPPHTQMGKFPALCRPRSW